jgi:hypothetical protein
MLTNRQQPRAAAGLPGVLRGGVVQRAVVAWIRVDDDNDRNVGSRVVGTEIEVVVWIRGYCDDRRDVGNRYADDRRDIGSDIGSQVVGTEMGLEGTGR